MTSPGSGLEMSFQAPDQPLGLSSQVELGLYRIVQESVNNALKHSKANAIRGSLSLGNGELGIMIEDDGVGFKLEEAIVRGGLGLKSLQSRAAVIGGELKIISTPGRGTSISIKLKRKSDG